MTPKILRGLPNLGAARRWLRRPMVRWPLIVLGALYALFLLGVNLAINTSQPWGFLRPADRSSNISWSWGWSVFPGFATVHGFYLTVEDDNIQLGLRIERAQVRFEIPAFLHKTFHATAVHAKGTSFHFRIKSDATPEAMAAGLGDQPPIPGFSDPPLRGPPSPPFNGDRSIYWTIQIDGVHAETREVWIAGVRFEGQALAHGAFTFRPLTVVQVDAGLDILGGDLFIAGSPLARTVRGKLGVLVDRFDPLPEFGLTPLHHIATDLTLDGDLENVGLLNPVFDRMRAPRFESSTGHFDLATRFNRGKIEPGSRFALQAARWEIERGRYRAVGTDTYVEGTIDEGPHGTVQVSLGPYEVVDPQAGGEVLEGDGMLLRMTSDRFDVFDKPFSDLGFEVQLESARVPDLSVLNAYLPKTEGFEVLGGKGELTGSFSRPASGVGNGDFRIGASDLALRLQKLELHGDLGLRASVQGLASSALALPILGPSRLTGKGRVDGHFTLGATGEFDPAKLAKFDTDVELVLHPLLPATVHGAQLVRYLSGEVHLDGDIPGLEFLDGVLQDKGVVVSGGAGRLDLDARLTHGVLGRASTIQFDSQRVSVRGSGLQGLGNLSIRGKVDEEGATPRLRVVTALRSALLGTESLPDFLSVGEVALTADSPEVELWDPAAQRPDLKLAARAIVLPSLSALNQWLPEGVRFSRGRSTLSLDGHSPPEGTGRLDAALAVADLSGTVGPAAVSGDLHGSVQLSGIAEEPWKSELLARSSISAAADVDGHCHAIAGEGDAKSTAAIRLHATGELPATPGDRLSSAAAGRATATLGVAAEVSNLAYLNQLLGNAPVRLHGGTASVQGEVKIAAQTVAPGSTVTVDTRGLLASIGPFWLSGPLHVAGTLGAPGAPDRGHIQASLASFALTNRYERKLLAEGTGVSLDLSAPAFTSDGMLLDSKFEGRARQLTVPDLSSLTAYLPSTKDLKLVSGSATASATLVHPSRDHGEARIDLSVSHAQLLLGAKPFSTDMHLQAALRALAAAGSDGKPLLETLDVGDTTLELSRVDFPSPRVSDREWWAKLRIVRGELRFPSTGGDPATDGSARVALSGDTSIEARDVLPWLHLYGSGIGIPGWLDGLLAFKQLKATAALELQGNHFGMPTFEAKGDHLQLEGRLLLDDKHTAGDFLLGVGPFSVGLDVRDKHSGVQLLGAGGWYRNRLKEPLE